MYVNTFRSLRAVCPLLPPVRYALRTGSERGMFLRICDADHAAGGNREPVLI